MWYRLKVLLALTTIQHCVATSLIPWVTATFLTGSWMPSFEIIFAGIITSLQTMGGFMANKVFDREGDLNQWTTRNTMVDPNRLSYWELSSLKGGVIALGLVGPKSTLFLAGVCFAVSIALAQPLPRAVKFLTLLNAALLFPYSLLKRHLGLMSNVIIAYLTTSAILFAPLAIRRFHPALMPLMASFFLISLAREVAKDIEDIQADRENRRRTFVLTLLHEHGKSRAAFKLRNFLISLLALGALANVLPLFWLFRSDYWVVTLAVVYLVAQAIKKLRQFDFAPDEEAAPLEILAVENYLMGAHLVTIGGLLLGCTHITSSFIASTELF